MKAEIIAVGSELLGPHRLDSNSLFLTDNLNRLGIEVRQKTVIGDNEQHITAAIRDSLSRAEVVIITGGLGPTADDLTREAVARALGRRLTRHDRIVEALERRFRG